MKSTKDGPLTNCTPVFAPFRGNARDRPCVFGRGSTTGGFVGGFSGKSSPHNNFSMLSRLKAQ
jgi:hypothetical protein